MPDPVAPDPVDEAAILAALGTAIATRRDELAMSQRALSIASGVSRPFLSGVESGARAATVTTLVKLARTLNTTPAALLDGIS